MTLREQGTVGLLSLKTKLEGKYSILKKDEGSISILHYE
jgi:hypothetical protein